jgi:hypothetical protein
VKDGFFSTTAKAQALTQAMASAANLPHSSVSISKTKYFVSGHEQGAGLTVVFADMQEPLGEIPRFLPRLVKSLHEHGIGVSESSVTFHQQHNAPEQHEGGSPSSNQHKSMHRVIFAVSVVLIAASTLALQTSRKPLSHDVQLKPRSISAPAPESTSASFQYGSADITSTVLEV